MDIHIGVLQDTEDHESICAVGSDLNNDSKGSGSELKSDLSDEEDSDSESNSH